MGARKEFVIDGATYKWYIDTRTDDVCIFDGIDDSSYPVELFKEICRSFEQPKHIDKELKDIEELNDIKHRLAKLESHVFHNPRTSLVTLVERINTIQNTMKVDEKYKEE